MWKITKKGGCCLEVYADVLVIVNYAVNLLCLLAASKLLGRVVPRWRLCAAALVGGLGSLSIFFALPDWGWVLFKIALSLGMTVIVFGIGSAKRFCHAVFAVFAVSFLFAGVLLALYLFLAPANMQFYNGVIYFDLSALALLAGIAVAYLLLRLADRFLLGKQENQLLYDLTLWKGGRTAVLRALSDTGNRLKEPFSGAPVILCDSSVVCRLWPPNEEPLFRVIPFCTVAGEGTLRGFQPDGIRLRGPQMELETRDVYIAASPKPLTGTFQAILNPQLVERRGDFYVKG